MVSRKLTNTVHIIKQLQLIASLNGAIKSARQVAAPAIGTNISGLQIACKHSTFRSVIYIDFLRHLECSRTCGAAECYGAGVVGGHRGGNTHGKGLCSRRLPGRLLGSDVFAITSSKASGEYCCYRQRTQNVNSLLHVTGPPHS